MVVKVIQLPVLPQLNHRLYKTIPVAHRSDLLLDGPFVGPIEIFAWCRLPSCHHLNFVDAFCRVQMQNLNGLNLYRKLNNVLDLDDLKAAIPLSLLIKMNNHKFRTQTLTPQLVVPVKLYCGLLKVLNHEPIEYL